jgi:hypothetical protein
MNIADQPFSSEFAVVDEIVRAHASDFAARGFVLTNATVEGSPRLFPFLVFHFSNNQAGLDLDVSFFPASDGLNGGFNAMIVKPRNRKLVVLDYLKRRGRSDLPGLFTYNDPATDLRRFAESTVRTLIGLLDNELKSIVEGKTFEETPIDWQGYK